MYEYKYQKYKNKYMNIKQIDGGDCTNIGEGSYGFVYDFNLDFIKYFTDFDDNEYKNLINNNKIKNYIIKIYQDNTDTNEYDYAIKINDIIKKLISNKEDQTFKEYLNNSLIIKKGKFNINNKIFNFNNNKIFNFIIIKILILIIIKIIFYVMKYLQN
jgi:hypothetical protein